MLMGKRRTIESTPVVRSRRCRVDSTLRPVHSAATCLDVGLAAVGLLSALILGPSAALCQRQGTEYPNPRGASIQGVVAISDPQNQSLPIPGVRITLRTGLPNSQVLTTTTDAEGRYQFSEVAAGAYTLEANLEGFRSF